MEKKKKKVVLGKMVKQTAGGSHAWYEAKVNGKKEIIRKPIQSNA